MPAGKDPRILTVVDLHADAIEVVLRDDLKDDGGAAGDALVEGLRTAVHRFAAGG